MPRIYALIDCTSRISALNFQHITILCSIWQGTLIHHYKLTKDGLINKANLIVATTNNAGAINMSVRDAARGVIKNGDVSNATLNMVEMAFRAYDPCFSCATHRLPGDMPLIVDIIKSEKELVQRVQRD